MKLDVYWCSCPQTKEREEIAIRTLEWWNKRDVILHITTPRAISCSLLDFNLHRRIYAETYSESDPYIVTDDDCIPDIYDFAPAVDVLLHHPEFSILSWWPENANIEKWTEIKSYEDSQVLEHVSVGGIRMCRKGHIVHWPEADSPGYDRTQADEIRRRGRKVGFFKEFSMLHLGEGKSEIWKQSSRKRQSVSLSVR